MRTITTLLLITALCACNGSDQLPEDTGMTDIYTDSGLVVGDLDTDDDGDGFTENEGDCNDAISSINPYTTDLVGDGVDQNCDGIDGTDADLDGYASEQSGGDDCDDENDTVYPDAEEIWYDGIDQQCDGIVEDGDQDGDGFDADVVGGDDCDDANADINILQPEDNTDGVDNNCSGVADDYSLSLTWDTDRLILEFYDYGPNQGWAPQLEVWDSSFSNESVFFNTPTGDATGYGMSQFYHCEDDSGIDCSLWGDSEMSDKTFLWDDNFNCYIWGFDTATLQEMNPECIVDDPTAW